MSTAKKILIAVIVVIILAVIGVAVWYYFSSGKTSPQIGQSATATEASAEAGTQSSGGSQSAGSAAEAGTPAPGGSQPAGSQSEVSGTTAGTAPAVISTGTEYWFTPLEKLWTGHKMEIIVVSGLLIALFVMISVIVSIVAGRSSAKNR